MDSWADNGTAMLMTSSTHIAWSSRRIAWILGLGTEPNRRLGGDGPDSVIGVLGICRGEL
jgi:hypothetical protein